MSRERFLIRRRSSLLKLTRNCFLDHGFESSNSEKIQKSWVQKLLDMSLQDPMGQRNEMQFQLGIHVANNSLKNLFHYSKGTYGITYILTNKSNKDILEN
ncbi:hypothetical protein PR048_009786 [Dryococelus australis]|uniref:Uncharacterized protein n=1 Tax=Dryococelus australis TaxID=614101 RepID=A0ABQ9I0V4_9NEOP|nr:hypothetical protein PR048_009786 [Dryococelus australis]